MVPSRTRARGLCGSLTLVVACCATACFNPSGTDTSASGTSTGGPGSTTGSPTTGMTGTSATTQPVTSTSGTTEVDPTATGTSTDASATTSATTAPASSTDPSSTGGTTADQTTGQMISCGDNVAVPGVEECDDGNANPNDGCNDCKRTTFIVFTTKMKLNGSLGGVSGADQVCQTEAVEANRQGLFRAWLSTDAVPAALRLSHANLPYVRTDGTTIADNWDALIKSGPAVALNLDAAGSPLAGMNACVDDLVWTGTDNVGDSIAKLNCDDWTIGIGNTGNVGSFTSSGMSPVWTSCGSPSCNTLAHLYCFEQPLG